MRPSVIGLAAGLASGAAVAAASRGPTLVAWPDRVRQAFPNHPVEAAFGRLVERRRVAADDH